MKIMKKRSTIALFLILALCLLSVCGCSGGGDKGPAPGTGSPVPSPSQIPAAIEGGGAPQPDSGSTQVLKLNSPEEILDELSQAMAQIRQPYAMDISSLALEQPEMDVKNLYYRILSAQPQLKYAYDIAVSLDGTILSCNISYMPYITGQYPEGYEGLEISSLSELISAAENNLGSESIPVLITNTALEPDGMNKALQQAGGGYFSCTLNRDATAILITSPVGMDAQSCIQALGQARELADSVISQLVSQDMSQEETALVLYSWLCSHVEYDQRYYSDKASMPYESQTALGALRDGTAICGGYSHALKLLFERAGIPCFNVSGVYYGEYHMWNIARINGQWLWFDSTSDRGSDGRFGFLRFALEQLDPDKYQWDIAEMQSLIDQ